MFITAKKMYTVSEECNWFPILVAIYFFYGKTVYTVKAYGQCLSSWDNLFQGVS